MRQYRLRGSLPADTDHPVPEPYQPWLAECANEELLGLLVDPVPEMYAAGWRSTFTVLWMQGAISKVFASDAVAHAAGLSPRRAPRDVALEIHGLRLEHLAEAEARVDGALVPFRQMTHRGIALLLSTQPLENPVVLFRWNAASSWPDITTDEP
jgi:hypothetical protein